jgi:predicted ATPase/DNA-binding winged helix-turn-helix (wHTH) protein
MPHLSEQTGTSADNSISFGRFRLIPAQLQLLEANKPVHLGSRALAILIALTERAGELVSKDELITRVWPNTFVEEGNLRVHVAALRRALGDGQAGTRYVANIPGRGYRFVAPVSLTQEPKPPTSRAPGAASGRGLPLPLMRMIGRTDVVSALARHLAERRFVTIVGPGGIGKTTVALAVADNLSASYEDGIRFVDLASLADPTQVPSAVASVLGFTIRSDFPIPGLIALLADKQMLLVLDSCEHVIEAAAVLAVDVLRGAPGVHILATSREPLRAEGERVQRLAPLAFPPASAELTAAKALTYPAVELFVERAAAVLNGFDLSDADAPIVAEICCRLDGIALAIELAAGRVDAFGLRGVAARLDDRFRLLTRGRRTALPRHQTLSATLDWSYDALPDAERLVLRSLGIFTGRFSLEAASAVVTDPRLAGSEVADIVANLVAKSLVTADVAGLSAEYRLLDTTRAYALEKLAENGEREQVAQRHADYYRGLFERAEAECETRPLAEWLAQYGRHLDNLRAALDWAFSKGDASIGVALTAAAVRLWMNLSLMMECRRCVERALSHLESQAGRESPAGREARLHMQLLAALGAAVLLTTGVGPEMHARALAIAETLDDADYQLRSLWGLFVDAFTNGCRYRAALALAERFCGVAGKTTDPANALIGDRMVGVALHVLGDQEDAGRRIKRMLDSYVAPVGQSHVIRFQFDQRVVARVFHCRILWLQGLADKAIRGLEDTVAEARASDHPASLFRALTDAACPVALLADDLTSADAFVNALADLSAAQVIDPWKVWAQCYAGVLLMKRGVIATGLACLRAGLSAMPANAFHMHYTAFLADMAEGLGRAGEPAKGLATIDEALARSERNEERWCVAEFLRIKGELVLLENGPQAAVAADERFQESLDWARRQGALSFELRTSISRARLRRSQGRLVEARALLVPVYNRFSEGFATADLKAARALIDQLA